MLFVGRRVDYFDFDLQSWCQAAIDEAWQDSSCAMLIIRPLNRFNMKSNETMVIETRSRALARYQTFTDGSAEDGTVKGQDSVDIVTASSVD